MIENPDPGELPPLETARSRWSANDLILFGSFFVLTFVLLPFGAISVMRIFRPSLSLTDLSAVEVVVISGIMDMVLVGFIYLLVTVVHGRSFLETIHWYRRYQYKAGFLIAVGATLAVAVTLASSLFPPTGVPPIEKLLSTSKFLWVFILFGVGIAPLFEEIIFRGFLFKVLFDLVGPGVAIPATAGLFALMHVQQLWGSWAGIALIFVVGYVLAQIRFRSSSLIPSLIVHTAYNGMLFAMYAVSAVAQKGL